MTHTTPLPLASHDPVADVPLHPSAMLLNLIVAFLTPMFLTTSGGNIDHARSAAIQTVNAYGAQSEADLITVAQIIAFGLAALSSLSLSLADNLSPSMILRLRGNANACNRAAEQNRRALQAPRPAPATTEPQLMEVTDEAAVVAKVAAVRQRAAESEPARPEPARPEPEQAANQPSAPTAATTDQPLQALWAAAAARIATEYTADLPNLPPAQRRAATIKAAMLSSCATDLLNGPPIVRLRPGDLPGFMRSNVT